MNSIHRKTIMLIDDSSTNNFLHKSILVEEGFNVIIFYDGASALAKLNHFIPDLIVLDLLMPGMDGFKFLEKKKQLKLAMQIPVLILTAKHNSESELLAKKLGVVDYLIKPVGVKYFVNKIQDALEKSTAINA
jgi:DNA-binding response OmpR family regulator